ncbi:phosphatase PAP2 family protein [Pedobacter aquatilis]|uniref:phosphatase PAP2 family protein n=1 Tax=Pedobacter aquatilis TaxID=351343 RepID=UPI0025B340D2|nr:phosphatase PAP2 family protein [Pedobacter aquatilis]MDN3588524.1 phosphatase PAP2 family protein [Pedobacter aquatilis]
MLKIVPLMLLFFAATLSSNAQEADLLHHIITIDTTSNWYAGNVVQKKKFKVASFIVPAVLAGYGFAAVYDKGALNQLDMSTKAELQEDHPLFAAHVDDSMQFAPAAAVYALNLSGVKGKHNLFDASMLYLTSAAVMGLSTHFVKQGIGRMRPNNNGNNSFPSGHTASAFMAAEFLHQEYKDVNPWIGYAGYFVATTTGTLRMYNNKHWFSDVVAGAGFGIASTKIAYLVYPYIKQVFNKKQTSKFTVMPYYQPRGAGLMLSGRL